MSAATKKTALFCLGMGAAFLLLAIGVASMYIEHRSTWASAASEAAVIQTTTSLEILRNIALQAHRTAHSGSEVVEMAMRLLLFLSALAGVVLIGVFMVLRREASNAK